MFCYVGHKHLLKLRDSKSERELEIAHECAEQAKTLAEKVLEFDTMNKEAIKILEKIYDDFNIS